METGQVWRVRPYAGGEARSDPFYRENMVLSDLPAGLYEVRIDYGTETFNTFIQINPGRVTYFTFRGREGFGSELPAEPGVDFAPPEAVVSLGSDKSSDIMGQDDAGKDGK